MSSAGLSRPRRSRGRPARSAAPDHAAILHVALASFAQHGFEGTTMRSVAAAAGVDAALISRQFGSKMAMWKAAVDRVSSSMAGAQARMQEKQKALASPGERLKVALRHFVEFSQEYPELGQFFIMEAGRKGIRREYVMDKIWRLHRDSMLPLLEEAKSEGSLPEGADAPSLLFILVGAVAMPFATLPLMDDDSLQGRITEKSILDNILSLFIR